MKISKLSVDEEKVFRKEVKKKLIDLDLSYGDLAIKTGYAEKSVSNMLSANGEISKFFVMAAAESLGININEIKRRVSNG